MSSASDFFKTVFIFLFVLGFAWWVGMIWQATGEDKLDQACRPVEFATDGLHQLMTALLAEAPHWTIETQKYAMGGCLYLAAQVLPAADAQEGGIR